MIEVGSREVKEDDGRRCHRVRATRRWSKIVGMIEELHKKVGREKVGEIKQPDAAFVDSIRSKVTDKIREVKGKPGKADRARCGQSNPGRPDQGKWRPRERSQRQLTRQSSPPRTSKKQIRAVFSEVEEKVTREAILAGIRPDGRDFKTIRPITCQVGVLPASTARQSSAEVRRRRCVPSPLAPAATNSSSMA